MALREEFNAEPAAQRHAVHHGGSRPGSRGHALWGVDEIVTLGASDGGSRELLDVLNTERIVMTAGLTATAELAIRLAADYARERKIFNGMPIGSIRASSSRWPMPK
ncbi:hypothetical protein [Bosea sp. 47.2.35]|uniref:hypothetical protein n=1 Tax=Bosea sp. 47.2.35 TaxID=2969304 RepID=UPI00214FED65|nr:hypothetical protein [Bosea sp. 47.2.35]MCR4522224.1 hypothetical protein [Bosea sp. 47.2.35]